MDTYYNKYNTLMLRPLFRLFLKFNVSHRKGILLADLCFVLYSCGCVVNETINILIVTKQIQGPAYLTANIVYSSSTVIIEHNYEAAWILESNVIVLAYTMVNFI